MSITTNITQKLRKFTLNNNTLLNGGTFVSYLVFSAAIGNVCELFKTKDFFLHFSNKKSLNNFTLHYNFNRSDTFFNTHCRYRTL